MFFNKYVKSVIGLFLIGTVLVFINNFFHLSLLKDFFQYPLNVINFFSDNIKSLSTDLINLKNITEENKILKKQLAIKELELLSLETLKLENARLRNLLNLPVNSNFNKVYAQVIARSPSNWFEKVVINIGKKHKVKLNTPIIDIHGLVGKVVEVNDNTSTVLLLSSPYNAVSVKNLQTKSTGVVVGGFLNKGKLKYIQPFAVIKENDILISTGIGGIYPKDIPVGKVIKVNKKKDEILPEVDIKFSADLEHLEEVAALLND